MKLTEIISMLGGIGLFLYGMTLMSTGLKNAAGDRLRQILERVTSNRFAALIVGLIVTLLVQSSSATVMMLIGFVDSGLMRVPRFSPGTGMTGLVTLPLSLDRAEQRRGRAGRLRPGTCYRLWTRESESSRPKKTICVPRASASSTFSRSHAWANWSKSWR